MIGVSDKSWLVDLLSESAQEDLSRAHIVIQSGDKGIYSVYFGLGHQVKLRDRLGVFKVSLAGTALGGYLLKGLSQDELIGRLLDVGTGGGVLALLLRSMGAEDITATDVSGSAVRLAQENEVLNFEDSRVKYFSGDLFNGLPCQDRYDTVIFNPPGWRTPSPNVLEHLRRNSSDLDMAPDAMFYGDDVLLRFLKELPTRLHSRGRAIVGLNSLVGIQDVLARYKASHSAGSPLAFRLLERHTLPLLFYSSGRKQAEPFLREEFKDWRDRYGSAYTVDREGRLYWSYEVV